MSIVGARVDGRLIHGQVANLWTTKLNISRIMVVDDQASESTVEKSGLRMAAPAGVKLSVLPISRAAENLLAGKYDAQRLLIIARKPQVFLALSDAGVEFDVINVGNMSQTPETKALTRSVNVVEADLDVFRKLNAKGIKLTAQMVPGDAAEDLMHIIEKGK